MRGIYAMAALLLLGLLVFVPCMAQQSPPWHWDLTYSGGGYWSVRVPVTVRNISSSDLGGAAAQLTVGNGPNELPLIGEPAASVRAVDAKGREVKCGVFTSAGERKVSGKLVAGDVVVVPVEAPAGKSATVYVYAGNPEAWAPPEPFGAKFSNGSFEAGSGDTPAAWQPSATDGTHRMYWQKGGARTGQYCARCEVDEGAKPQWVQYHQRGIPVVTGEKYRFTGWVKAKNVKGKAGWYVHVDGEKPLMVNIVKGYEGTFDWRKVTIEFTVPKGGAVFVCGTVLWGTGTAWYDDAKLERLTQAPLKVEIGPLERMDLRRIAADGRWPEVRQWKWRVPLVVRNFSDRPVRGAVVTDWHRPEVMVARYAGYKYDLPLRLEMPQSKEILPAGISERRLVTVANIPPRSELVISAYLTDHPKASGASKQFSLAELTAQPTNLVRNADFERPGEGGMAAADWPTGEEGQPANKRRFTVRRVHGGVHGQWCLQLHVDKSVKDIGWVGSRQKVPVQPNTTYILCGFIKSENLAPDGRIYGHFLRADGSLCQPNWGFATSPGVKGTKDWTFTSTIVTTPSDCHFIDVHLTMRATGTLWHDAVCLMPVLRGFAGDIQARSSDATKPLAAWVVNPQVKVFPDDVFPGTDRQARLYACRNEYEPLQIAVRSANGGRLHIRVGSLRGPGGATIPAPQVYENRYVQVDFPVGYDHSDEPAWIRHRPRYRGNDGWSGWWPDPLAPVTGGSIELKANHTVPLWIDYYIPPRARPGDYHGTVELRLASTTLTVPVRLRVWPYTLPQRKHTFAIYDLRLRDQSFENVRKWYTFLARYNVSPGYVFPSPKISYENGQVKMDFTEFDRSASLLFDDLKCRACYTPWFFYAFGWGYPPKKFFGREPFTPEWIKIFQSALRQFFGHLKEKGWDKYVVYYVSDEPDRRSAEIQGNLARICDLAREAVPGLWVYSSTWVHLPRLDGHLNLWGIGPHGSFDFDALQARRKAGDRFWFTTDGHMCTDTPYLAIERLLPWLCIKYDVEGYEFWGVNWWTYNPWEYGWHSYHLQSHAGKVFRWTRYPNGDGFITYPGDYVGVDGPLPSIRMVAAREGIEDYELFYALRQAIANAKDRRAAQAARKALAEAEALVEMPNRGGRYSTYIMPDPDAVVRARTAAGEALARLLAK